MIGKQNKKVGREQASNKTKLKFGRDHRRSVRITKGMDSCRGTAVSWKREGESPLKSASYSSATEVSDLEGLRGPRRCTLSEEKMKKNPVKTE